MRSRALSPWPAWLYRRPRDLDRLRVGALRHLALAVPHYWDITPAHTVRHDLNVPTRFR